MSDHLTIPRTKAEKQKALDDVSIVPMLPKDQSTCKYGSTHWVSPLDLRFTHDSVRIAFKPFYKDGKQQINKGILDSLKEVLE